MDEYLKHLPELANQTESNTATKLLTWWEVNGHTALSKSWPPETNLFVLKMIARELEQEIAIKRLLDN